MVLIIILYHALSCCIAGRLVPVQHFDDLPALVQFKPIYHLIQPLARGRMAPAGGDVAHRQQDEGAQMETGVGQTERLIKAR